TAKQIPKSGSGRVDRSGMSIGRYYLQCPGEHHRTPWEGIVLRNLSPPLLETIVVRLGGESAARFCTPRQVTVRRPKALPRAFDAGCGFRRCCAHAFAHTRRMVSAHAGDG